MKGRSGGPPSDTTANASSSRIEMAPGQTFGGYRLIRCLGSGGFAQVWEAERSLDGRLVALKVLNATDLSESSLRRFEREGRLAGQLSHPCTVFVFGADIIDGRQAIAMEIVRGGTLQDRIDQHGPMPPHRAVDAILDVIDGLEAAHSHGILHRDVKPSNCFVTEDGRVKIGDFGISRSLGAGIGIDSGLTDSGIFIGTLAYASPEQINGRPLDHRSDLYSVGATLYTLLVGHHLFAGKNPGELVLGLAGGRVDFSTRSGRVPRHLQSVVLRLLAKDPSQRYPSYEALRAALLPLSSRDHRMPDPARRFGAYAVDVVVWNSAAFVALFGLYGRGTLAWIMHPTTTVLAVAAGQFAVRVAAFTWMEHAWRKTPGKHFFQLAIRSEDGGPISFAQALLRNVSFWMFHEALGWGAMLMPFELPLLSLIGAAVPCLSMRRHNGYAGLHELVSRTRTRAVGLVRTPIATKPSSSLPSVMAARAPLGGERRGPYRIDADVWRTPDAALMLASDDLLGRQVWIHERFEADRAGTRSHAPHRSTRLRWLQGGGDEARSWNAYEVPSGMPLVEFVASKGRLEWVEGRGLILQLADEITASLAADDLPASMTLESLWIDSYGHLKLLEFPYAIQAAGTLTRGADWVSVMRQATRLLLEGRHGEDDGLTTSPLRAPVPDRARGVLERLLNSTMNPDEMQRFNAHLHELCTRPATISPQVRTSHLVLVWSLPAVAAIGAFVGGTESLRHRFAVHGPREMALTFAAGVNFALVVLGLVALVSLLFAFVFRGGPVLRCFGTVVRERDGLPASRVRCLLRAAIGLLPALLVGGPVAIMVMLAIMRSGDPSSLPPGSEMDQGLWRIGSALAAQARSLPHGLEIVALVAGMFLALVLFVGVAAAIIEPQSGIHDRIVGTRLLPR